MYNRSYQGNSQASLFGMLLFSSALTLSGCASTEQRADQAGNEVKPTANSASSVDPYEGFNRSMYGFNMTLDKYLLKPVAMGYKAITPDFMEAGVSNFFNNLKGINVVLNDFLQGKVEQGASDTGRFFTNSTLGVLGLFDVASDLGMQNNVEDFGQTLAVWGVAQGPYLVLPILGPTTIRDGGGIVVDKAANPGTYVPGTGILEGISDRANAQGALNFIDEAALDPYVFMRESFLQYRQNLINDGKTDAESYDLDVDADVDIGEISEAKPKNGGNVLKPGAQKATGDGQVKSNLVDDSPVKPGNGTVDAFSSMSKSFDGAEQEFEQASAKMDELEKKKRRFRRHR